MGAGTIVLVVVAVIVGVAVVGVVTVKPIFMHDISARAMARSRNM